MNNIPPLLRFDDYMARHSDMVDAAQGEPLTKEQIAAPRWHFIYYEALENELCLLGKKTPYISYYRVT